MLKKQYQLTLQEGKFWDNFILTLSLEPEASALPVDMSDHETTADAVEGHQKILQDLTHKSNLISESYRICTNPPTRQTYAECKEILQAMGVSCINCDGPFEAEALASSLNRYADYVASEDTVIYLPFI